MNDESHFDIYNIQNILRQWDMPKISLDFYLEGKAFYFSIFSWVHNIKHFAFERDLVVDEKYPIDIFSTMQFISK